MFAEEKFNEPSKYIHLITLDIDYVLMLFEYHRRAQMAIQKMSNLMHFTFTHSDCLSKCP